MRSSNVTNRETLKVEPVVRLKAESLGTGGVAWLSLLPELIDDLERQWSIAIDEPLGGGTAAYVAQARTADGRHVVVKIAAPDPGFARQVRTIAAAYGHGYVRLLAHDLERTPC